MTTKRRWQHEFGERLEQALRELHDSRERGELDYAPTDNGWDSAAAFRDLVELGEAKPTRTNPIAGYRITLLGLIVYRRILDERNAA